MGLFSPLFLFKEDFVRLREAPKYEQKITWYLQKKRSLELSGKATTVGYGSAVWCPGWMESEKCVLSESIWQV